MTQHRARKNAVSQGKHGGPQLHSGDTSTKTAGRRERGRASSVKGPWGPVFPETADPSPDGLMLGGARKMPVEATKPGWVMKGAMGA